MKFILSFAWKPDISARDQAIASFRQSGGLPSEGVKLLGRWTRADFNGGFDLLETDNVESLAEFAFMWSDLMELTIVPVLEDQQLSAVLERATVQRKTT